MSNGKKTKYPIISIHSINNSIIETYIFCGINNQWYVVVKDLSNGMLFKVYIECYVHIGK